MPEEVEQIKALDARQLKTRVLIVFIVLIALVFGWLAIRWQLGSMIAELTAPTDPNAQALGQFAVNLAPGNALASWLAASANRDGKNGSAANAEKDFQETVKLSPNDFRWWIEFGRAEEQAEDVQNAEKAFVKAVNLAPNYTFPRWQLGNFYLRQNRGGEAFDQLKKAAETNPVYRDQVLSIAWDYYDRDPAKLEQIAGDSATLRAGLAKFYASKERAEDSLRIWNSLSEADKKANADAAQVIARALFDKRFYRESLEFVRQLGIEPDARQQTVQNAGFEKPIVDVKDAYFGWRITPAEKLEIKLDPTRKAEGNRSLRVAFSGYINPSLYNIYQIITVEAGARYSLNFKLRTENLKSGGMPQLEIYNATDEKTIVTSQPFPTGTNAWQQIKVEFTAPPNAEAVGIRTIRAFCGENCPIVGAFWYDDFKLEKLK